jgi:hypothetical protein
MNTSTPLSASSLAEHPKAPQARPWLSQHHQATRQRTVALVKAVVDHLLQKGQTVTLEAICTQSRELDPKGKGITKAGVLGNAEAHAYYRQHSTTYQRGLGYQRRKGRGKARDSRPLRIDPDRDVGRARQRYLLQPKADLVDRLLSVEQELGEARRQLASLQFELLDLSLQREESRKQTLPKDHRQEKR